jgi:hypothetical protein
VKTNDNISADEAERYMKSTERLSRRMHKGYFPKPKEVNIYKEPH